MFQSLLGFSSQEAHGQRILVENFGQMFGHVGMAGLQPRRVRTPAAQVRFHQFLAGRLEELQLVALRERHGLDRLKGLKISFGLSCVTY